VDYELSEVIGIAAVYAAACIPAWIVFNRRRDPFDPRVFFLVFYAYVTTGPCIFKVFVSGAYHPGLKVDRLMPVLFSCATAIVGFSLGSTFALRSVKAGAISRAFSSAAGTRRDRSSSTLVRELAIVGAALSLCSYGYFSYQLQAQYVDEGSGGKAYVIASADELTVRNYYFFAAATTASMTLAIIADAYASRGMFSVVILSLLAAEFGVCMYGGERDFLLVGGVWCLANWRKLSNAQVMMFAVALVGWLGISPVLRSAGLGFGNQFAAVEHVSSEDWLYSVTHFAPNVHVFTNVAADVPGIESYWRGYSLLGVAASFLPGESALKEVTPSRWFRDVYDMQKVAGFAFSQDAEAYLNFGWIGPPIWFAVWGYLLSVAYRRAARPTARLFDVLTWWYAVATSLFGVRSDSRGVIKMLVLGMVAAKLLCWVADAWAQQKDRGVIARPKAPAIVPPRVGNPGTWPAALSDRQSGTGAEFKRRGNTHRAG